MSSTYLVIVEILLLTSQLGSSSVLNFLPFGSSAGDNLVPPGDDTSSGPVGISVDFHFFGKIYNRLFVNVNGGISFKHELRTYTPQDFPMFLDIALLAAYWADVDTRDHGGHVWYRETTDSSILHNITQEIQCTSFAFRSFHADWAFISSWEEAVFYGASATGKQKLCTFQVVLAYDSSRNMSFGILHYDKLEWTTGTASNGTKDTGLGGTPAMAGFDAGDGLNYFAIPGSRTPNVTNLVNTTNSGEPGRWIFRIDSHNIVLDPPPVPPSVSSSVWLDGQLLVQEGDIITVTCGTTGSSDVISDLSCDNLQPSQSGKAGSLSGIITRARTEGCSCTRTETSGCYTNHADVNIKAAYGPFGDVTLERVNVSHGDDPLLFNVCPSEDLIVNCTASEVFPGANFSLTTSPSGNITKLDCHDISQSCSFKVLPARAGNLTLICTAVNSAFGIFSKNSQSVDIEVREPPHAVPTLRINGEKFTGEGDVNRIMVMGGELVSLECDVEGGVPEAENISIQCSGIQVTNGTFIFKRGINVTDCICQADHVSECYELRTQVEIHVVFSPDNVTLSVHNATRTGLSSYNACISKRSGLVVECSVDEVSPAANMTLSVSPMANFSALGCSANSCWFNIIPIRDRYTMFCTATNSISNNITGQSLPVQLQVFDVSACSSPAKLCQSGDTKADLHILVDVSDSTTYPDFRTHVDFLHSLVSSLPISPSSVQVGVTTFSDVVNTEFWMNQHTNKADLLSAIDKVHYAGGTTQTSLGLEYIRTHVFTAPHGDRPGVANVLILVTDGPSKDPVSTKLEAEALHKMNINALCVGVGNNVDMVELQGIASEPSNVFTVSDADGLANIESRVKDSVCTEAISSKCNAPIDLVFLVDKSGSIKDDQFFIEEMFLEKMIQEFHIGPNQVKVALALFANHVRHQWCFDDFTTQEDLLQAVQNISCPLCQRGQTSTGAALEWTTDYILTERCGPRPDVTKVVIVLTDGHSTERPHSFVVEKAVALRATGATVITVGVGNVKDHELRQIASDDELVFTTANFNSLLPILGDVANSACKAQDYTPMCQHQIDVTFLLDKTVSVNTDEFSAERSFVQQIINTFEVGPNAVQIAAGIYASSIHPKFCFNDHVTQSDVMRTVESLHCTTCHRGGTATAEALQWVRQHVLTVTCGARPAAIKVVVLVTDGQSSEDFSYLDQQTRLLHNAGVHVVAIGAGRRVNQAELRLLASDDALTFTTSDLHHVVGLSEHVASKICDLSSLSETTKASPISN